jgi:hypothetical protein
MAPVWLAVDCGLQNRAAWRLNQQIVLTVYLEQVDPCPVRYRQCCAHGHSLSIPGSPLLWDEDLLQAKHDSDAQHEDERNCPHESPCHVHD